MITLADEAIEQYLSNLDTNQSACVLRIRAILLECSTGLTEVIDTGKWFGGLLTYNLNNGYFQYALGPRSNGYTTFHMMPYYQSKTLQDRHSAALKRLLSGKSCIRMKKIEDIPQAAIRDIVTSSNRS